MEEFWIKPAMEPHIVTETATYLVLYKPPRMHTVPLHPGKENTLLDWVALHFPEVRKIWGHKEIEGGLLHRLDYETQGLVLCARTAEAFGAFSGQQYSGNIIKEYEAVCHTDCTRILPGFPSRPEAFDKTSAVIESAFRPFGEGRKAVRPVLPGDANHKKDVLYRTEIVSCTESGDRAFFDLRMSKGFRHQIRCHLSWIGRPILNDGLYGLEAERAALSESSGFLALRASAISFSDPETNFRLRISAG